MECRACFKIYTNGLEDEELFSLIDKIGVEPGITDNCLYFGLKRVPTNTEDFQLSLFIHEVLSSLLNKANLLKDLKDIYYLNYVLDIKFTDIEEEIANKTSFELSDEIKEFISMTDTLYNLNDGYFE